MAGLAVLASFACLAGCGGRSAAPPPAGHGTPAAAAVGFLQSYGKRNSDAACAYALPSQATICRVALRSGARLTVSHLGIGSVTVQGDRALVSVTGTLCVERSGQPDDCVTNHDGRVGQPSGPGPSAFAKAYQAVEQGASSKDNTAVPCSRVAGKWYVDLGR